MKVLLILLLSSSVIFGQVQAIYRHLQPIGAATEGTLTGALQPREIGIDSANRKLAYKERNGAIRRILTKEMINPSFDSSVTIKGSVAVTETAIQTLTNKTLSSPTLSGTAAIAAAAFSGTLTLNGSSVNNGTMTNNGTISGGTGNFTTLQQGGVQAVTTSGTQTLTNKSISASQITAGTLPVGAFANTQGSTWGFPANSSNELAASNSGLIVYQYDYLSNANNPAFMTFHRNGLHAQQFGLDINNKFYHGGWSAGANKYLLFTEANKPTAAQVTPGTFPSGNYGIQGDFTFQNPSNTPGTFRGINGVIADNDQWYVGGRVGSGTNDGQLYIGTNDDGTEPIIFGTGSPSSPTTWGYFDNTGFYSTNRIVGNSGQIKAVSGATNGTYLELAKYDSALPGYPTSYYPTLKTDFSSIYFSTNGKYVGDISNLGTYNQFLIQNNADSSGDIVLRTDGQPSYIRSGKVGIGNNSPDSTLSVTGSANVTSNMKVDGAFEAASFRSNNNSAYWDTTVSFTWSGFTTGGLGNLRFIKIGKLVTMEIDTIQHGNGATGQGVSKSGIVPLALWPQWKVEIPVSLNSCILDASGYTGFFGQVSISGKVTLTPFYNDHTVGDVWTDGGTRGLDCRTSVSWMLP